MKGNQWITKLDALEKANDEKDELIKKLTKQRVSALANWKKCLEHYIGRKMTRQEFFEQARWLNDSFEKANDEKEESIKRRKGK